MSNKRFYTRLVEHYFRLGVRHTEEDLSGNSQKWHYTFYQWLSTRSHEEREFISIVFATGSSPNIAVALKKAPSINDMDKLDCLNMLECDFALYSNLITKHDINIRNYPGIISGGAS